ncbi:hypothetical protein ACTVCO_04515 [Sanguibacter sp. A247]|uniref:hypothetical protein n=1 Tax=unclassified Sanguibacter TaxID=2645534 RepID=UPI003FD6E2FF
MSGWLPVVAGVAVAGAGLLTQGGAPRRGARERAAPASVAPDDPAHESAELVLAGVAAALRAGAPPAAAWVNAGIMASPDGIPVLESLRLRLDSAGSGAAVAVLAACRVAVQLGAPLADALEHVGREAVAAEARAARRHTVLAGPRATARLLAWLPIVGVVLAAALGSDPVTTVLAGGPGALSVILGTGALVAGRRWIAALVRRAERA